MGNRYKPSTPAPQPSQRLPGVTRPQPSNSSPSAKLPNNGPSVPEFQGSLPPGSPKVAPLPGTNTPPLPPGSPTTPEAPGVQPISFNGGYYNPTTAPFGFDMSTPGVQEQFWNNNQDLWFESPQLDWVDSQLPQFQDPWAGENLVSGMLGSVGQPGAGQQFWNGVGGSFNSMGGNVGEGYQGPNNAQEAYGMTKGMLPGSMQPQFDAYYDRMKDKVMSDVNSQSAARGAYGSNTALNNTIGAGLDVEAQRAKANTDFMLADSANQMNWQGLLGNQARGADLTGLGIYGSQLQGANYDLNKLDTFGNLAFKSEGMALDKDKTVADLAFGVDDQRLERLGAGIGTAFNSDQAHRGRLNDAFDASGQTQDQREDRVNTLYNQTTQFSNDVMNYVMQNYDSILSGDQAAFEEQIAAMLGQTADQRGWDDQTKERIGRDVKAIADIIFKNKAAGNPIGEMIG